MANPAQFRLINPSEEGRYHLLGDEEGDQRELTVIEVYIDKKLIQEERGFESRAHLIARRVLQGTSVVAGFGGRIPFIEINLQLGGDNRFYGALLAYGNCVSLGYLVAYSLLEIVNEQMSPKLEEERVLQESRTGPILKKVFLVSSIVLGFASQVPFAYIAYTYNEPSTLNPDGLVMPAITFAIDSWVSVYSSYMGMKLLREQQSLDEFEKEIVKVRGSMVGLLQGNVDLLTQVDNDQRTEFVGAFRRIQQIDSAPDRVQALYTLFSRRIMDITDNPSRLTTTFGYTAQAYGFLCGLCNIGTLAYIGWLGMDQLAGNLGANVTVTTAYVAAALYLNSTAIPNTAKSLFYLFKQVFTCTYKPTLSDILTPKLSFAVKALGLATAALSYGPSIELSEDYYGEHEWLKASMEVTLSCAVIFLTTTAVLAINDQVLEYKVEKLGTEEEKAIVEVHHKMKELSATLAGSPLLEFARFLNVLPAEAFNQLTYQTQISTEALGRYLHEHGIQVVPTERDQLLHNVSESSS